MKKIYKQLWELAKPYYKKGRPFDMLHIQVLMKDAEIVCRKEKIDDSLFMPLVILHDIGYGTTEPVYFDKNLKKKHMIEGAALAKKILKKLDYPKDKIEKIAYWISVHDNWILGDNELYKKDPLLATFNDLDYMWMASPRGFLVCAKKFHNDDKKKMLESIIKNEKPINRPFATKTTKALYTENLKRLKSRYGKK